MNVLPGAFLTWDVSSEPVATFLRYAIYRRETGDTDWTRIATITDRSLNAYQDYAVASGVAYDWDVTVVSDSSGEEIESEHTAGVSGSVYISSLFIHDRAAPENYVELKVQGQTVNRSQDIAYLQPWGRSSPTAHIGTARPRQVKASYMSQWSGVIDEVWDAVENLIVRQSENGALLLARQGRNVLMNCQMEQPQRADGALVSTVSVTCTEVYFSEAV